MRLSIYVSYRKLSEVYEIPKEHLSERMCHNSWNKEIPNQYSEVLSKQSVVKIYIPSPPLKKTSSRNYNVAWNKEMKQCIYIF